MEFLLINDGRIVKAKSRLEALKLSGYEHIYWQGSHPYGLAFIESKRRVYAIKRPKGAVWK